MKQAGDIANKYGIWIMHTSMGSGESKQTEDQKIADSLGSGDSKQAEDQKIADSLSRQLGIRRLKTAEVQEPHKQRNRDLCTRFRRRCFFGENPKYENLVRLSL